MELCFKTLTKLCAKPYVKTKIALNIGYR